MGVEKVDEAKRRFLQVNGTLHILSGCTVILYLLQEFRTPLDERDFANTVDQIDARGLRQLPLSCQRFFPQFFAFSGWLQSAGGLRLFAAVFLPSTLL
jgi:hypothetical protein